MILRPLPSGWIYTEYGTSHNRSGYTLIHVRTFAYRSLHPVLNVFFTTADNHRQYGGSYFWHEWSCSWSSTASHNVAFSSKVLALVCGINVLLDLAFRIWPQSFQILTFAQPTFEIQRILHIVICIWILHKSTSNKGAWALWPLTGISSGSSTPTIQFTAFAYVCIYTQLTVHDQSLEVQVPTHSLTSAFQFFAFLHNVSNFTVIKY